MYSSLLSHCNYIIEDIDLDDWPWQFSNLKELLLFDFKNELADEV